MDIERARKLLGKECVTFSDEQILNIINNARTLSLACAHKIETKLASEGTSFFTKKPYLGVK